MAIKRILLVECDPDISDIFKMISGPVGFNAETHAVGKEIARSSFAPRQCQTFRCRNVLPILIVVLIMNRIKFAKKPT
jgi:hypothetical protein